ncbi:MAG: DUF2726 domain-containing protein [Bradyrhizobium sp.]|nr:DUF2726 domain-containing protein [Alphaproteobacteria bacterium]MDE2471594.1 DUF2726 domain-containing protein [Bradyrhizobium sp.]
MSGLELGADVHGAAITLIIALALFLCLIAIARVIGLLPALWPRASRSQYRRSRFEQDLRHDQTDASQQLNAVMASSFEKQRVMSSNEYRVFKIIEDAMATACRGYRVFAQTSLGEILRSQDKAAYRSINSKRVDILVVDQGGWPILAVEYQGSGHYQGTAAARDAIKKEALRKAGVRYMEVSTTDSDEQIRFRAREHLGWTMTAPVNYGDTAHAGTLVASEIKGHNT